MIVALEGPDRCGKTSVFNAMRERYPDLAKYVPGLPLHAALFPHMAYVELRDSALWGALYDRDRVYVCDRHFAVSAQVYSSVHGRTCAVDCSAWKRELRVVYFDCPLSVLRERHAVAGDELFPAGMYAAVLEQYERALLQYRTVRVDSTQPPDRTAEVVATYVQLLRSTVEPLGAGLSGR